MCKTQCFLVIVTLFLNIVKSWDIAITHESHIEFYNDGNKTNSEGSKFTELTALAYDAAHNILLFVDKQNDSASIFSFNIAIKKILPLVKKKPNDDIQGLAFDPVRGKLFWTDNKEKSIYWISLTPGSKNDAYGNLLFKMDDEKPRSIAVDSCRGYIYWTNINVTRPTIERARHDGTDRATIVDKNIRMPFALTLDQQTERLYWVDDKEGIHYTIESSDLNGNDRQTVLAGIHHRPNTITVSKDSLYWVDWGYNAVWQLPKTSKNNQDPVKLIDFQSSLEQPFGIAANYDIDEQTRNKPKCQNLAELANNKSTVNETFPTIPINYGIFCLHGEKVENKQECKCMPGYIGERCDTSLCQNYCLQGDCSLINGEPACSCQSGYAGIRCEHDLCQNFCLNDGKCTIDPEKQEPMCSCHDEYEGERCEKVLDTEPKSALTNGQCNCTSQKSSITSNDMNSENIYVEDCSGWDVVRDPILMALGILTGTLCIVCAVLTTKILYLRRRPRIKKRIIVNKNVTPLTARPDQCEITIENCCNMNICETPCFEPRSTIRPTLLDKKLGKEDKRNLIDNMEHDDY